MNLESQSKEF